MKGGHAGLLSRHHYKARRNQGAWLSASAVDRPVLRTFNSGAAKRVNDAGGPTSPVWQRNYYEHVIRNKAALD
jgi:hypothetical protein